MLYSKYPTRAFNAAYRENLWSWTIGTRYHAASVCRKPGFTASLPCKVHFALIEATITALLLRFWYFLPLLDAVFCSFILCRVSELPSHILPKSSKSTSRRQAILRHLSQLIRECSQVFLSTVNYTKEPRSSYVLLKGSLNIYRLNFLSEANEKSFEWENENEE